MASFKSKPVHVEAWQWNETKAMFELLMENGMYSGHYDFHNTLDYVTNMRIDTRFGRRAVDKGDWIVKNCDDGKFAVLTDSEFHDEYEPTTEPATVGGDRC